MTYNTSGNVTSETNRVSSTTRKTYDGIGHLLTVTDPNVLLWELKPHEDGLEHGIVTRVWKHAAKPSVVHAASTRFSAAPPCSMSVHGL